MAGLIQEAIESRARVLADADAIEAEIEVRAEARVRVMYEDRFVLSRPPRPGRARAPRALRGHYRAWEAP